jgi:hypothetical protein
MLVGNVDTHRSQNYAVKTHKIIREDGLADELFVLFGGMVIMPWLRKYGGDRLRQEPERSSRCMPGYLMQLVKTRRETQLPTLNWLSLPN